MASLLLVFLHVSAAGEHSTRHDGPGQTAPRNPVEVVQQLHYSASKGDEETFRFHLTWSFQEAVHRMQLDGDDGFSWPDFMRSLPKETRKMTFNQFFERATVRVEVSETDTVRYDLALEDGHWRIKPPKHIVERARKRNVVEQVQRRAWRSVRADKPRKCQDSH